MLCDVLKWKCARPPSPLHVQSAMTLLLQALYMDKALLQPLSGQQGSARWLRQLSSIPSVTAAAVDRLPLRCACARACSRMRMAHGQCIGPLGHSGKGVPAQVQGHGIGN